MTKTTHPLIIKGTHIIIDINEIDDNELLKFSNTISIILDKIVEKFNLNANFILGNAEEIDNLIKNENSNNIFCKFCNTNNSPYLKTFLSHLQTRLLLLMYPYILVYIHTNSS